MSTGGSPELPEPLWVVLDEAAAIVAGRPVATLDREQLTSTADGIRRLLELLERAACLRTATSRRPAVVDLGLPAPGAGSGPRRIAANLIAAAPAHVADGVAAMAQRLHKEDRDKKRGRDRLDELRASRDRAAAQAEIYRREAAGLREQVSDLSAEIASLNARLTTATAQIDQCRRAASDPLRLAEALTALLVPTTPADRTDGRSVQAGEPPHVDPGRHRPRAVSDLGERLRAAAAHVPLPDAVRASVQSWLPPLLAAFANPPRPRVTLGDDLGLAVDVLGGGTEIGGSCVLVSAGGTRILVDAGTRPRGTDEADLAPRRIEKALSAPLDAIVVTHAHNDHGGWVPAVLKRQPDVPVFLTAATGELLSTMWSDAAKVLARRVAADESWAGGPLPPYQKDDVVRAVANLRTLPYGRRHRVGALDIELFGAGHIVGAAGVVIGAGSRRVVVSGDVSGPGQATVGGIAIPESARRSDLLLLESTYAGQDRPPPRRLVVGDFVRDVANAIDAGGRVLVPAFALGRAQEIALILSERLPDVEVLVDGLARDIGEVYERHNGPEGQPLRVFVGKVRPAERHMGKAEIAGFRSGVVIATSGMLTSGPAVRWAERILPDARSLLTIVGYQDEDSPGRHLLDLADRGGGRFALPRAGGGLTDVTVAAGVRKYRLGAHASADELVSITADVQAAQVMLVHGHRHRQEEFAGRLLIRRQPVVLADRRWTPPGNV